MCGIAGYHGSNAIAQQRIDACLALMGRRGPDHRAVRSWNASNGTRTHLLHSRLSIIDFDARSNQPMQFDGAWIAFNGELYNYVERRDELQREGVALRTHSDTEAMLASLRVGGWSALDCCEGMWAFALYDERNATLSLCRDRFGEKPLYILRDACGVYFGSEIKFVAALSGRRLEINYDHLWRYLVNGYKALYKEPRNFFKDIEELRPGTVMHIDADLGTRQERYWQPRCSPVSQMSFQEAVAGTRARIISSAGR